MGEKMTINMKDARVRKCWKFGHDWAYNFDNIKGGWIKATCLRCYAEQCFFVEKTDDEPDLDDDGTYEPPY